jgi:ABC-type polysaccharide/polyol phosphate transport system ATPase subunit
MIAIDVKNLTKIYRIYKSPTDRLKEIILRRPFHTEFVVLKNINLSLTKGVTFGIIGENGAGKSTLLKILAKTLKPTSGELLINGRTAALLELGAGFNPELTGEENIYLNAYLMGLSKDEVDQKKQEIIDFSELDNFIKRPVKTYSSGMHVRLAFSIATSVNPDILIIDEALAVGDQHFQKKCIDRMMQFKNEGKTIFFCSHALYLVQELCNRSLWLHQGQITRIGDTPKVINAYNDWVREKDAGMRVSEHEVARLADTNEQKLLWVEWAKLTDEEGRELKVIKTGRDIWLRIFIRIKNPALQYKGHIGIGLNRNDEEPIFGVTTKMDGFSSLQFYDGQELCLKFPSLSLLSGLYYFVIALSDEHALHPYDIQRTEMFSVENLRGELGIVKLNHEWELKPEPKLRIKDEYMLSP